MRPVLESGSWGFESFAPESESQKYVRKKFAHNSKAGGQILTQFYKVMSDS